MAEPIKRDYDEAGIDGGLIYNRVYSHTLCVNFVASSSYSITKVVLRGHKNGTFESITVGIYETDSHTPTGAALVSKTRPGSEISTAVANFDFTFDINPEITEGQEYAIVVNTTGAPDSSNSFDWKIQNYSGYYRGTYPHEEDPQWLMYSGRSHWFQTWGTEPVLAQATLDAPADDTENYYLNSDWLAEFTWTHDLTISYHTVWFGPTGALVEQTDRSRYSIISLKWYNGTTLDYETEYQWKVVTVDGEEEAESNIFTLTTMAFAPPVPRGDEEGGGGEYGGEGGKNIIRTIRRLVVAAANKVYYEDE